MASFLTEWMRLKYLREFLALFSDLFQDFYSQAPSFLMCSVTDRKKLYFNFDSLGECYNSLGGKLWQRARNQDVIYDKERGGKKQFEFKGSLLFLKQSKLK